MGAGLNFEDLGALPEDPALRVGEWLFAKKAMLVTAESCTGGAIAKSLTDIAGASAWFERGFVTYSNLAKVEMLNVPETLISRHGAVSEPVAKAMAKGALWRSTADCAIAVTGIAGPDGGTPEKPVGTVYIAWAFRKQSEIFCTAHRCQFKGGREKIRQQTVLAALAGLLENWPECP